MAGLKPDYDLLKFWLQRSKSYIITAYNEPIHQRLLEDRKNLEGPCPTLVVLAGGEQSGKSTSGGEHVYADAACAGFIGVNDPIYWIVGERYQDCRKEFQYLIDEALQNGFLTDVDISFPQEGPCKAVFSKFPNKPTIKTLSSSDFTTLASEAPTGILMVEAGRQSYQSFRTLWTRAHHKLAWFLVSGTFEMTKGRYFPDLWKVCQGENEYSGVSLSLPTYANPKLYEYGPDDPKVKAARATLTEEEFAERFLGQPRPSIGVVFQEFRRSTHVKLGAEYDPGFPVRLWVDPGWYPGSYSVLWVQIIGQQIRVFDEVYENYFTNEDILDLVRNHPRFVNIERVVIDVAAETHAGASTPAVTAWRKVFSLHNIPVVSRYVKIQHGLTRTHDKLRVNPIEKVPYLIFHPRCENTIWEFEEGYKYNVRSSSFDIRSGKPQDRNNHSAKAVAYGLVDAFGFNEGPRVPLPQSYRRQMAYDRVR